LTRIHCHNLQEVLHEGNLRKTVNKETYIDILRRLRDAVRRKRPEKWRTKRWFLPHEDASAHRSVVIKAFIANDIVTTLEHPPYSPDLSQVDFYLFPQFISALKGWRFCNATDIKKNAMEELKRLPQNGSQEYFQNLYGRW
jgi:hypothetical protein